MNAIRPILGIARADFQERVRRYSYLVTLLSGVFLGYLAGTGRVLVLLDDYRGVYTAGWIGTMVGLVTTVFVSWVGFYVVKNSVDRDRSTRVGQILAATPLLKHHYLIGKFLSNFAVLSSVVLVLELCAIAMYFFAGEAAPFRLWALVSPFLLIALPMMALTAAIAVVFECVPGLRGGLGNFVWFFGWSFMLALPAMTKKPWLDPMGVLSVLDRFKPVAEATIPNYHGGLQLTFHGVTTPKVAEHLLWPGLSWSREDVFLRLGWVVAAFVLVLLASLGFDRFDSSREFVLKAKRPRRSAEPLLPQRTSLGGPATLSTLKSGVQSGPRFFSMVVGELRLALQGCRWWWYVVAAALLVAQLVAPIGASRGPLLAVSWLWPALLWSAMGSRETRFGVEQILFSAARIVPRQMPACWFAGFFVATLTGAGAFCRLAISGDSVGLAGIIAGAVFIPSLALFLGVLSGSGKFFEGLYVALWYEGPLNGTPGLDFTGAANGARLIALATVQLMLAIGFVAMALIIRSRQLRHN